VTKPAGPIDRLSSRSPGERALQTRERILDMTAALVREVPFKDLTPALVTQRLGLTPPAFYRYFAGLNDALAACGETMRADVDELAAAVDAGTWQGPAALDAAADVIDAFGAFWSRHRPLYRVIDLLADEGDKRFVALRQHMFEALTATIAAVTARAGDRDPVIAAGIVVATLVHVTAREPGFVKSGITRSDLRRHLAMNVASAVTGSFAAGRVERTRRT
jgi:AcrR family transcriptional regulator